MYRQLIRAGDGPPPSRPSHRRAPAPPPPALPAARRPGPSAAYSPRPRHPFGNIVRRLLGLPASRPAICHHMTAALAWLPGEQHEIGLMMPALFLRRSGVRVLYLGAAVPVRDLVRLAQTRDLDALCLSAGSEASWDSLAVLIDGLTRTGRRVSIFLGGMAATDHPAAPGVELPGNVRRMAAATIVERTERPTNPIA